MWKISKFEADFTAARGECDLPRDKPLGRKGHLTVHISQKERTLQIRVMDDGVGMSPDEFEESMQQEHRSEEGFGLRNVVDRLRIYYETKCTVKLERCEQGTTMLIEIKI